MPATSVKQQRLFGMVHAAQNGETPASPEVSKIAKTIDPDDAEKFASTSHAGLPMKKESIGAIIGRYNSFGERLSNNISLREMAEELMQVAEAAEFAITNEQADDWHDGHTIQRNIREIRTYVKEISKIAEEYDSLHSRARALVDDCGHVLQRYFEIKDDDAEPNMNAYDTGEDTIRPDNAPIKQVQPDERDQMAHSMTKDQDYMDEYSPTTDVPVQEDPAKEQHNKQLVERLVSLARHRLTGEQLIRFDTLPEGVRIRAAWRIVRS